ncbi:hypothetical protein, partial [Mesorhizobium sp. M1E.F.Ca.ET.063.01.1.1]|uniref:hypothetical protein n=1 Tax=Mesorhizobium sp. M1E.F.Ca.ET.063.01.1.1 TaxID=2496750 RepID=UPI001AECD6FA
MSCLRFQPRNLRGVGLGIDLLRLDRGLGGRDGGKAAANSDFRRSSRWFARSRPPDRNLSDA